MKLGGGQVERDVAIGSRYVPIPPSSKLTQIAHTYENRGVRFWTKSSFLATLLCALFAAENKPTITILPSLTSTARMRIGTTSSRRSLVYMYCTARAQSRHANTLEIYG